MRPDVQCVNPALDQHVLSSALYEHVGSAQPGLDAKMAAYLAARVMPVLEGAMVDKGREVVRLPVSMLQRTGSGMFTPADV